MSESSFLPMPDSSTEVAQIQPTSERLPPWMRRWLTFPAAIGFLLFIVVFFMNIKEISEPDIWWHLRNAQYILSTHTLPNSDQYSWTAAGSPWIDHEWLSELAFYGAYALAGLRGLVAFYLSLSAAIFLCLYYLCIRAGANPKTASIVLSLGIMMGHGSFGPRMLLLGWLLLVVLLLILQQFELTGKAPLWVVPPMFCVWINLHGSWVFGLIVLGIFIAAGMVEGEMGLITAHRWTRPQLKSLITVTIASAAALFINPFGYKLVNYPFDLLFKQQSNMLHIEEWHSVDFQHPQGRVAMILLLLLFTTGLLSIRRWKLSEVLLGCFALYTGFTHWRMQFCAALVFMPVIAQRLTLFPPYDEEKEKPLLNAAITLGVLITVLIKFPSQDLLQKFVHKDYPVDALAFMKAHGIKDHVFNSYGFGGYMIYHAPEIKTFVDGRADIFVYNGVFDDYYKASVIENTLEIFERYKVQHALLGHDVPVAYLLNHQLCWKQLYADDVAKVFEKLPPGTESCPATK